MSLSGEGWPEGLFTRDPRAGFARNRFAQYDLITYRREDLSVREVRLKNAVNILTKGN